MQAHSGGLDSRVVPQRVCDCVRERATLHERESLHTQTHKHTHHCDARVAAVVPELTRARGRIHPHQHLKHITDGGGANSFILINHTVRLPVERLHVF